MISKEFKKRFTKRPLSYSQLSSFEWDKDQWYNNYILGIREPANPAMAWGSVVGDSIGTPDTLVPTLVPPGVKEYEMRAVIDDVPIIGFADHFCINTLWLHENKTSDNPKRWDQKKVNQHGQLSMYALMLFLREKIKPEDIQMQLNFIPVLRGGDMLYRMPEPPIFIPFITSRSTLDILHYAQSIRDTLVEMEAYYKHKQETA